MKKHGLASFGQFLGNISAGKLKGYEYEKKEPAHWPIGKGGKWILNNIHIVDVDKGVIFPEEAIVIEGNRFGRRLSGQELKTETRKVEDKNIIDGKGKYLVPGMSDIHCHMSLISEYDLSLSGIHYFDAQRMKNCEYALSKGCTTVRDSAGAYDVVRGLKEEIDKGNLLGPRILPSYSVLTPKGGMWDINPAMNKAAEMIFGGKVVDPVSSDKDIRRHINEVLSQGAFSIKIYLEDRPLYGGSKDRDYNKFTDEQIRLIREIADHNGRIVESHAMFIEGARRAIKGKIDSIGHMTVDGSYTLKDAEDMVNSGTAVVPTLGVGSYLAMDCGPEGYPDSTEYKYYRELLDKYVSSYIDEATIPELRKNYRAFYNFIVEEKRDRLMPGVGKVWAERCHGFAVHAPESFKNFRKAGAPVGLGTDGGTGTGFPGAVEIEFDGMLRYGYSHREILRISTLGNMEIIKMQDSLGSIEKGKLADMLIVGENPLENIMVMTKPEKVFKEGICLIDTKQAL